MNLLELFSQHIPRRPQVTDILGDPLMYRQRDDALLFKYIQHSHPNLREWIATDFDQRFTVLAVEESGIPLPNIICINPENAHAHLLWLLRTPVSFGGWSREKPKEFFEAVTRGITRRIGGDFRYRGTLTKNPVHSGWRAELVHAKPYELRDLNNYLTTEDKAFTKNEKVELGIGRNYDLFNSVRQFAYRESVLIKSRNGTMEDLRIAVSHAAQQMNSEFDRPLPFSEIRSTVKSITNWTWTRYNGEGRSEINRKRAMARWDKTPRIGEPWKELGIGKTTYYKRRKSASLPDA